MPKRKSRHSVEVRLPAAQTAEFMKDLRAWVNEVSTQPGFANGYLAKEIFSKYLDPKLVPKSVRGDAAIQKWLTAESRNANTSRRLFTRITADGEGFGWVTVDRLISEIRRFIARILGPLDYPACLMHGTLTNGASTTVRRSPTAAVDKLTGRVVVSESAIKHWLAFASGSRLSGLDIAIDNSSTLFTVPKKSDIDRVACKEPHGNMLLQRSVGEVIRRRLRRYGIDLSDQTRNQALAQRAWRDGLATIDLSSASDLISRGVVELLLPFDWWSLLDDLRVKSTRVLGKTHELEMFSSMGNGFTFELESLIFFAITKVVLKLSGRQGTVSVYGDDIICPSTIVPRLGRVLSWFGFILNHKKTHHKGPFRESCGKHYHRDFDVTPFYVREAVRTLPQLINTLNHLLEWDGRGWGFFTTKEAYQLWDKWIRVVPKRIWGGIDPQDPTALVTGHAPRMRIVPITKPVECDEAARLLTWMLRSEHDEREDVLAVDPQLEVGFRLIPVVSRGELTSWSPGVAWR